LDAIGAGARGAARTVGGLRSRRAGLRVDVLPSGLPHRDELSIPRAADLHPPQLLGAAQLDGARADMQAAADVPTQEVGRVGHPVRLLCRAGREVGLDEFAPR